MGKEHEVTGARRKLHNLGSSPNINMLIKSSRIILWAEYIARIGEMKNSYILIGKSKGYRPLGKPKWYIRGCNQKFSDWVGNEIYAYNKKHSLRSNTKCYGSKSH
jgi:hypothetical protein